MQGVTELAGKYFVGTWQYSSHESAESLARLEKEVESPHSVRAMWQAAAAALWQHVDSLLKRTCWQHCGNRWR